MKSADDALKKKLKSIYESEIQSPLFARVAETEIENNNLDLALGILESGLNSYPSFPVGYFIYGKCLALKGDTEGAKMAFMKGAELIHNDESLNYYLNSLDNLNSHRDKGEINIEALAQKLANAKMPKFAPPAEDYTPEEIPDFDVSLYTETFARILIAQNKTGEAVSVYKELIKRNPGKSDYYLEKIQSLRP